MDPMGYERWNVTNLGAWETSTGHYCAYQPCTRIGGKPPTLHIPKRDAGSPGFLFFSNVFPVEKWRVLVKQIRNPCPFNANDVPLDSCENRLLVATRPSKGRSEYS